VLDKRIPLEICLTSNVHTGAARDIKTHPFGLLYKYKFRVTLNTDDRLMSDTTMTKEFKLAVKAFRLGIEDLEKLTINAMKSAFQPYNKRIRLIYDIIKPGYAKARLRLAHTKRKAA
jgi:adenosine deaminase